MRILHVGGLGHRRGRPDRYLADLVTAQRAAGHDVGRLDEPGSSALAGALDQARPDVLHLHLASVPAGLLAATAVAGIPTVLTLQPSAAGPGEDDVVDAPGLRPLLRAVAATRRPGGVPEGFDGIDLMVCSSRVQRLTLVEHGLDPGRLEHLGAALDVETVAPARQPGHGVLYVGRTGRADGVDVLVAAVRRLPRDLRVTIAGDGPERLALEHQAAAVVPGRIVFLGPQPAAERQRLMREAAVVVVSSQGQDHRPGLVAEAFSVGRPVVGARSAALAELVEDGVTGALVSPDDPGALAEALRILAIDPSVAHQQGREARRRAEELFAFPAHVVALDRIYAAALSRRRVA